MSAGEFPYGATDDESAEESSGTAMTEQEAQRTTRVAIAPMPARSMCACLPSPMAMTSARQALASATSSVAGSPLSARAVIRPQNPV